MYKRFEEILEEISRSEEGKVKGGWGTMRIGGNS